MQPNLEEENRPIGSSERQEVTLGFSKKGLDRTSTWLIYGVYVVDSKG
jgi:hypothetical protein